MKKTISYNKLSKKAKRAYDVERRKNWSINPVTRKPNNPGIYHRKRMQFKNLEDYELRF